MEVETLCENPWLELKVMRDPANGVGGYVYSHEKRCDGRIVAILPYRRRGRGYQFLLRHEITPCWGMDEQISSITGGVDYGMSPFEAARHELEEEGGLAAAEIAHLGYVMGTKSTDTVYHLFAVDADECTQVEATGDGSELEAKAHCEWHSNIGLAVDPMVYVLHHRLMTTLGG